MYVELTGCWGHGNLAHFNRTDPVVFHHKKLDMNDGYCHTGRSIPFYCQKRFQIVVIILSMQSDF